MVFASKDEANRAFEAIPTPARADTAGRLQKRIYYTTNGMCYIQVDAADGDYLPKTTTPDASKLRGAALSLRIPCDRFLVRLHSATTECAALRVAL